MIHYQNGAAQPPIALLCLFEPPETMSYENTKCPCGEKKLSGTMICQACRDHLASTIELVGMDDPRLPMASRRAAAIRVLSMARNRTRRLPLR